jgi:hypothetical protein
VFRSRDGGDLGLATARDRLWRPGQGRYCRSPLRGPEKKNFSGEFGEERTPWTGEAQISTARALPSSIPGPLGYAEAEPLALRVLAVRDSMADTLARKTVAQLVTLYEAWGKPDRAAEFQRR